MSIFDAQYLHISLNNIILKTKIIRSPISIVTLIDCSSTSGGDEYMLVCVARPFRNKGITELSLMEGKYR